MVRLREVEKKEIEFIIPKKSPSKVIDCRISRGKLITRLDDEREISINVSALTKWKILDEDVKPEQLKNYEIRNEGRIIYFPDVDEILPAWKVIEGLHSCN